MPKVFNSNSEKRSFVLYIKLKIAKEFQQNCNKTCKNYFLGGFTSMLKIKQI